MVDHASRSNAWVELPQMVIDTVARALRSENSTRVSLPLSIEAIANPMDIATIESILSSNPHALLAIEDAVARTRQLAPESVLELSVDMDEGTDALLILFCHLAVSKNVYRSVRDDQISWWRTRPLAARQAVLLVPRFLDAASV